MEYRDYIVKVGSYKIPMDFIEAKSCKPVIHGQDLNSYVNANGVLKRNALKNKKPTIEWDVPTPIKESEFRPIMDEIQKQFIDSDEKSAEVTAFFPEIGKYETFKCYQPDLEIEIDSFGKDEIIYSSITIKFIAYGGRLS